MTRATWSCQNEVGTKSSPSGAKRVPKTSVHKIALIAIDDMTVGAYLNKEEA